EALANGAAKWSAEILKRNRKLILSEKVKALEILDGLSRAVIGVEEHRGPSILDAWHALGEIHRQSVEVLEEYGLAHTLVPGQPLIGNTVTIPPPIPAWKEFAANVVRHPTPVIGGAAPTEDGGPAGCTGGG